MNDINRILILLIILTLLIIYYIINRCNTSLPIELFVSSNGRYFPSYVRGGGRTSKGGKDSRGSRVCCNAMTPECNACKAGMSVPEYMSGRYFPSYDGGSAWTSKGGKNSRGGKYLTPKPYLPPPPRAAPRPPPSKQDPRCPPCPPCGPCPFPAGDGSGILLGKQHQWRTYV